MTIIFEKIYKINDKGYYTAWFDYSGHIKQFSIRIMVGAWKENKSQKYVMSGECKIRGDKLIDMCSQKEYTRREFLATLDGFTTPPPSKRK